MTPQDLSALAAVRARCRSGEAKQLRTMAGLQLSEVASAIGVSGTSVWRWENLRRQPTGPSALRYEALLVVLEQRMARA